MQQLIKLETIKIQRKYYRKIQRKYYRKILKDYKEFI